MEQQDSVNAQRTPADESPADAVPPVPAEDGTWGVGAAAAMDNLRRHHFGARHKPQDERPDSE